MTDWGTFWMLYEQVLIIGITAALFIAGLVQFVIWMDS